MHIWRANDVVKSMHCSCTGPELSSQPWFWAANYHHSLQLQRIQLRYPGLCGQLNSHAHTHPYT